jgi:hypothetical protein
MRNLLIAISLLTTAACAPKQGPLTPATDLAQSSLKPGTTVCISEIAGVRYALEDELVAWDLAPESSCMAADIQLEESGEPKAWSMRYQRIGDAKWLECKSAKDSREAFAEECISRMMTDLGDS